jgi:signal transduction histidine kinase
MEPITKFFLDNILIVEFVYGLAFFAAGLAMALEIRPGSQLPLARALPWLAAFGLVHGLHEWVDLFPMITAATSGAPEATWVEALSSGLKIAGDFCLIQFAVLLLFLLGAWPHRWPRKIALWFLAIFLAGLVILRFVVVADLELYIKMDRLWADYTVGLAAAILAAWAMLAQQRVFARQGWAQFDVSLTGAALAFLWYGLLDAFISDKTPYFPSSVINADWFLGMVGIPIQLFRTAIIIALAVCLLWVKRVFEEDARRQMARLHQELEKATQELGRLYEEVREQGELRGRLLEKLVNAQEEERRRIARELHDETSQALTALAAGLGGVEAALVSNPNLARRQLAELKNMSMGALEALRAFIYDLRPSLLDDMGLVSALRWYVHNWSGRGIQADFAVSGPARRLAPQVEVMLFRIAQEALSNVRRHSQASQAVVRLEFTNQHVVLSIEDNGIGFVPAEVLSGQAEPGWGLLGVRERIALIGGTVQIDSAPGRGTKITAMTSG